jgi:protein-S-isoprenylcysteine O-methyltransferase Ste14
MSSWSTMAKRVRVPLGFVFAAVYFWLAHPNGPSIAVGSCIALVGVMIRAFASGHVQKNEQLATSGPYAYTRNPLYLGSLVIVTGFALAARSWWVVLIALGMFFIVYIPVMIGEERFLRAKFPEFDDYCRQVPRLFPRLSAHRSSANAFSAHLYWKHREYNAAIGSGLTIAALIIKAAYFER